VPLIEARGICKSFGSNRAVRDVSFAVEPGQILGLLGPNGAGKTTLFSMVAGDLEPDEGTIIMGGRTITTWAPWKRRKAGIGRTFQVPRSFEQLTVHQHLEVSLAAARGKTFSCWRSADSWSRSSAGGVAGQLVAELESVGLQDLQQRRASSLSLGERKRLEIAAVLSQQPRVLLMDEPTAGISAADAEHLVGLLLDIRRERPDLSIVLTSHDMDVFFRLSDEVMLMVGGELMLSGSPEYIRSHPMTIQSYLGTPAGAGPADNHADPGGGPAAAAAPG
jgi:branched-chain amino acid transport system ATP-binding protein